MNVSSSQIDDKATNHPAAAKHFWPFVARSKIVPYQNSDFFSSLK
jgi:hypothetical protein